ncbi:MAG TPA: GH1 family beta-glucosidase [Actinocatenispora sp.]
MAERLPDGFPADFVWGVSTSAYQIEGAVDAEGRGPSVWDTFCAEPGRIDRGDTGAVACDHYRRYAEDVTLMAGLGVGAYRFSVSWPRVLPTGSGPVNVAGLDFYDRLVDELRGHGITPVVTLYHWDTPQPLEDVGGWLVADTAHRFAEYAGVLADRLGDRVGMWITLNEPAMVTMLGYGAGVHAPGKAMMFDALPTAHHQLLGHGLAVRALRAAGVAGRIGIANNHTPVVPASTVPDGAPTPDDLAAATAYDTLHNRLFADPVLLGRYPELPAGFDALAALTGDADALATIAAPLDFYGINYYQPTRICAPSPVGTEVPPELAGALSAIPFGFAGFDDDVPRTGFGWPVVPQGLSDLLGDFTARYGDALPPVYVTESGASFPDPVDTDGTVHDDDRIAYLAGHLDAVAAARAAGADVRGYFVWSLIDNFEWSAGYQQRFGLVHVDYATQRRTPKSSYDWFRRVIDANR